MALVDYSLERFPEELADRIETIDGVNEFVFGDLDPEAEDLAHRTNVMIAEWIQRLAASASGSDSYFMPDHSYVGLHYVDLADDVQIEKFEVGFFRHDDQPDPLVPTEPFITLYSWREQLLDLSVISSSFGFRCEEISAEAEAAIYEQVLEAVTKGFDTAS